MRRGAAVCLSTALLALGTTAPTALATGDTAGGTGGWDPGASTVGSYIVVLKAGSPARTVAARHADRFGVVVGHVYRAALQGYSAHMTGAAAAAIAKAPQVKWVQRDKAVHTTAQALPTGVNRADADLSPTAQIDGTDQRVNVDVAVIDTGIDLRHPDLNVYSAGAKNCALLALSANDGNGHGTHVAGTIGALDTAPGSSGSPRAPGCGRSRSSATSAPAPPPT